MDVSTCQGEVNLEPSPKKQTTLKITVYTRVKHITWSTETCHIPTASKVAFWIYGKQEMKHFVLSLAPEI